MLAQSEAIIAVCRVTSRVHDELRQIARKLASDPRQFSDGPVLAVDLHPFDD